MPSTGKAPRDMEDDGAVRSCISNSGGVAEPHPCGMMASSANRGTVLEPGRDACVAEDRIEAGTGKSTTSNSGSSSSSGGGGSSSSGGGSSSHNKGKQHLQQNQQHQQHGENHWLEGGVATNRRFVEQLRRRHDEEEEEEEEEEGEEEANSDRDDGFLDDFARELDGASSEDEQAEMQPPMSGGDGDEQVARALQEAEWRRNLPHLPGMHVPSDGDDGRPVSSIICSGSGSGSIFDTGGCSGGGASSGGSSSSGGAAAAATGVGTLGAGGGGRSSRPANCGVVCHSPYTDDDDDEAAIQEGGAHSETPPQIAKKEIGGSGRLGTTVGPGRPRGKGSVRGATPGAWPPGGLGEGEGLRINDFPDEILEKVAGFASLPRCVSKRVEKYRVKIVRERVFTALETSATLPASKAKEVEDAIFSLCGGFVTKAYKAKAREMSFNLRVGKNDPLRERLLSGSLLPSDLVRMSSNDLAPLSVRRERERFARKRIREVTSSRDSPFHTVTDRFACVECGHEKTQYRTWRRKAVVDRVRVIVQCLQCRHSWEL
ncbi:unnamed protein product [Ectocarpus fasciculatus]